ncbi:MAG: M14 family zinc carboxypeptidase, partial [Bacteroidota bacterium]
ITSPENHSNLDQIKEEHRKLTNTSLSPGIEIADMPLVLYQGTTIHGNEPSGCNGALAVAYYLAAGQGQYIDDLLDNVVILLDPVFNPDGMNRFASWTNTHKGETLISDPISREYNEAWPRARTNHYWFDLNRDWLLLTHPESQGRIKAFHDWKPDILTDHHEMGSNSTFFFQPGIPSRTNPNTPQLNQDLTGEIAKFHAAALDEIGSLYYSRESFDDFYYGKGSTYPDAHGCIGILFEQASSRGHYQETVNGILTFPFTIRNQVATMLSTQKAALNLREEILEYKRQSFLGARELARRNPIKGYLIKDDGDHERFNRFYNKLPQHQINIYRLTESITVGGEQYTPDDSYYVPLGQDQYRLVKTIFETVTTFQDSLFYDVSAWTLPLAANITYAPMKQNVSYDTDATVGARSHYTGQVYAVDDPYAYLIDWNQYLAPAVLYELLQMGAIVKQSNEPFTIETSEGNRAFGRGTLIVPVGNNQSSSFIDCPNCIQEMAAKHHVDIYEIRSGQSVSGVDIGSRSIKALENPKAVMIVGDGVSSYDAGEVWHHFDRVLKMPVPHLSTREFSRADLSKYRTMILPEGSYSALTSQADKLKTWIRNGGTIIACKGAINWLKNNEILSLDMVLNEDKEESESKYIPAYAGGDEERGARFTGGMIAMIDIDLTHPLFYGYKRSQLPVFKRGNNYFEPLPGKYSTPGRYSEDPLLSGYLHVDNQAKMPGAAAVFTSPYGRGQIIGLVDNPLFRGYWYG